ncbi:MULTISPECIES: HK97 family phage prohead protease [Aeromonas]|uniref:HK97 family phage prohead protease n=1 Tax=Aeromonas TaxID=642 RepID=UPI0022E6088A|nr:HK97 family phage prohead protease [Aeromonas sp. Y301-2]
MPNDSERRFFRCEVRAEPGADGQGTKIVGHAAVFNRLSENLGGFREIIKPGAFDGVMQDDVRGLFNHDPNFVLGRTKSNTMRLAIDDEGLGYEIDAPSTQTVQDLVLAPMRRGDIDSSSFQFKVAHDGERWFYDDDGLLTREITKFARLYDVGPVAFPAYPDATAASRSMQEFKNKECRAQEDEARERRERHLQLIGA